MKDTRSMAMEEPAVADTSKVEESTPDPESELEQSEKPTEQGPYECVHCDSRDTTLEEPENLYKLVRCHDCGHCEPFAPTYDEWPWGARGPYQGALNRLAEARKWVDESGDNWDMEERYATEEVLFSLTYLDPKEWQNCYTIIHEVVIYMLLLKAERARYSEYLDKLVAAFTNLNEGRSCWQRPPKPHKELYDGADNDERLLREWANKGPEDE